MIPPVSLYRSVILMRTPFLCCLIATLVAGAALAVDLPSDDLLLNRRRALTRFDDFVYTASERTAEVTEKLTRVRKLMIQRKLECLVIGTERNFQWLTGGGRDSVVLVQRESPVKLVITNDKQYLVANNIESPRVMTEELGGLGFASVQFDWFEEEGERKALAPLLKGRKVAFDDLATAATFVRGNPADALLDFIPLYYPITRGELRKYRWLGKKTVEVLEQVAQIVAPGMTEHDVQYLLCRELWYWDILPTVVLSAADERFAVYRHPLPIGAPIRRLIALNVCTRRWGLTISTTRVVHFGEPEEQDAKMWEQGSKVYAAMWDATKPGARLGDVLTEAQRAYESIKLPGEWRLHHQGGMILGLERLYLVQPGDKTKIVPGMVLAWNPTARGTKYEDTMVVRDDGTLENLTPCLKWPVVEVSIGGKIIRVPALLVRKEPD